MEFVHVVTGPEYRRWGLLTVRRLEDVTDFARSGIGWGGLKIWFSVSGELNL